MVAAAALTLASLLGAGGTTPEPLGRAAHPADAFAGVPQRGLTLGAANAPVTLVEYGDPQCPYCARWASEVLPAIVRDYVRPGRVRLVFHGLAFLGPDSETALRATLAAGLQNRLWSFLHELYAQQGPENSGWVAGALPAAALRTRVDLARLSRQSGSVRVAAQMATASRAAERAGVRGTPTFEVGRTGASLQLLEDGSLSTLRRRLDALLTG